MPSPAMLTEPRFRAIVASATKNATIPAKQQGHPEMPDDRETPTTVAFLLVREFSMLSVVSAVEPLRAANTLTGRSIYDWRFYSDDGAPISASNGMIVNVAGRAPDIAKDVDSIDFLFVCGGGDADPPNRARLHAALHVCSRSRMIIGSLSTERQYGAGLRFLVRETLRRKRPCEARIKIEAIAIRVDDDSLI